jgi:hypothetical protein
MRESAVEAALIAAAEAEGWITKKLAKTSERGDPDRWFGRQGVSKFIEVKAPGERPNRQQLKRIWELIENGFDAAWVDNVEDGLEFLRR